MVESLGVVLPDAAPFRDLDIIEPHDLDGLTILDHGRFSKFARHHPVVEKYVAASAGVRAIDLPIPGAMRSIIAGGQHCGFVPMTPDSPWYLLATGEGTVAKPLVPEFPTMPTYAVWRQDRNTPDDLGPYITALAAHYG